MTAQQQSLETLLGISSQRKSLKQQLDAASIKAESGRTTLADLPTVQIGCKSLNPEGKGDPGFSNIYQRSILPTRIAKAGGAGFKPTDSSSRKSALICARCRPTGLARNRLTGYRSHMITEADGNAYEDSSRADSQPPSKRRCLELPTARSNVNKAKELTVGWIVTANLPFTAPSNPVLATNARLTRCVIGERGAVEPAVAYDIFGEYGIRDRIGAGVCDNVSSNDTCLASLYRQLSPAMAEENIRNNRTRCFGHIVNLAARAFLWGEDPDSFEREAFTEAAFQVEERELRLWRKRGAVGKLHNIVRFVRASPQRRELMKSLACSQRDEDDYHLFEEDRATIDLELMQNNETRWNSTFMMIQRAIRKREQIDHFITYLDTKAAEPRQRVPVQDHLSQQDWLLLAEIQSLLKPLYEITMRCQGWAKEGRYGALWEVMIGMEYLLNFFEEQKLIFSPPDGTADELQIARASATTSTAFQFIFALLMSILLRLSQDVVLHELIKVADARNTCHSTLETNIPVHSRKLRVLMMTTDDAYKSLSITYLRKEQSEAARTMIGKAVRQDEPSQFDQWMQSYDRYMMEEEDELGVYMRQGPVRRENLNPILWWKEHQEEYPRLSKFALDILAIPAMSVDPERTFSVTKLTISSQRHSLSPEIIEEIQCLRNWLGHQAITVGEVVSFGGDLMGWDGGEA
uniref:HAT C-terminal dimerisation domain-containing protein n=1 Tax=Fusarium oxysporum (strain Fo5176) TaxID=660025 RepID=A0A0D2YKK9_FUSOF